MLHLQADISKTTALLRHEPSHTITAGHDMTLSGYGANLDAPITVGIHD